MKRIKKLSTLLGGVRTAPVTYLGHTDGFASRLELRLKQTGDDANVELQSEERLTQSSGPMSRVARTEGQ